MRRCRAVRTRGRVRLAAGQPEGPLLEDRFAPVPQRQPQAQPLMDVTEPGKAVLAPPVRTGAGVVVRQVIPCLAVGAVVLADRPPLALTHIRAPQVPVASLKQPVFEPPEPLCPLTLGTHHCSLALRAATRRAAPQPTTPTAREQPHHHQPPDEAPGLTANPAMTPGSEETRSPSLSCTCAQRVWCLCQCNAARSSGQGVALYRAIGAIDGRHPWSAVRLCHSLWLIMTMPLDDLYGCADPIWVCPAKYGGIRDKRAAVTRVA